MIGYIGGISSGEAQGCATPLVIDPLSILIAFGVAALVGIVFGFYPALRAARMDPIVALRTE